MKVSLINYTQGAVELLILTKSTRLTLSPGLLDEIKMWPEERKLKELEYMAGTIPSSWEFVDYVFLVEGVSRACTHQMVRTRQASYAQQSLRVVGMNEFDYVYTDRIKSDVGSMFVIDDVLGIIKRAYQALTNHGLPAEDARGILPTNVATNIICKYNLRAFSELARSRTGGRTQNEYQQIMKAMVDEVLAVHPWAEKFIFKQERNYFDEIEAFAEKHHGHDLKIKGELLKICDLMRKKEGGNSGSS